MAFALVTVGTAASVLNDTLAHNVAAPASVVAGNVLLMFVALGDGCTPTTPTGFTLGVSTATLPNAFNNQGVFYWKIATASEPGPYPLTIAGTGGRTCRAHVEQYSGADTTTPINATAITAGGAGSSDTNFDCPAATAGVANCGVLGFSGVGNFNHLYTVSINDSAALAFSETGSGIQVGGHAVSYNFAATGTSITGPKFTSSNADTNFAITIALNPVAAAAPPPPSRYIMQAVNRASTF